MLTAATLLQNLGFLLYAGPMIAFAILVGARRHIPHLRTWDLMRTYRAWGAGFGLSMGATVLGALARYGLQTGGFSWTFDSPEATLVSATFLCFFGLWASNIILEIWSLEPLRKLDKEGVIADVDAYEAAAGRFHRHLSLQAVLAVAVGVLATLSGLS